MESKTYILAHHYGDKVKTNNAIRKMDGKSRK